MTWNVKKRRKYDHINDKKEKMQLRSGKGSKLRSGRIIYPISIPFSNIKELRNIYQHNISDHQQICYDPLNLDIFSDKSSDISSTSEDTSLFGVKFISIFKQTQ